MKLRVCDGVRERSAPASLELVEEAFGPGMREGSEIALSDGDRWIAAIAVGIGVSGEAGFLLSGTVGQGVQPSGRVAQSEALRHFREFVMESARKAEASPDPSRAADFLHGLDQV